MSDKGYVFLCPMCGKTKEHQNRSGVVCDTCHVFMTKTIAVGAFEEMDPDEQEVTEDGG